MASYPLIIQGGMGVGVSGWRLANAVASTGQLGVVSGVALDTTLARRLQLGDKSGDLRAALAAFPLPDMAQRILDRYYVPGGIDADQPFRPTPRLGLRFARAGTELTVVANFVEVYLAKRGHQGPVGINYLEKIQMATADAAYGAMLAGVDYLLVGAGIPIEIAGMLNAYAVGKPAELTIAVAGATGDQPHRTRLDPAELFAGAPPELARPRLLAIVSSAVLAAYLMRNPASAPDGFVLEGPTAGGHSAPPRGPLRIDADDQPIYGPRDEIQVPKVAALGLPFWLAGGQATSEGLAHARSEGAAGIQVGSAFALCRDSGIVPEIRTNMVDKALAGTLVVRNAAVASPTGFPFKMVHLAGTVADDDVYNARKRLCDLGYLRTPYERAGGQIGYRCQSEPVALYVQKGGAAADTENRRCLCNGLLGTIGLAQRHDVVEPPLVTLGQELDFLPALVAAAGRDFGATDVVAHLLGSHADNH